MNESGSCLILTYGFELVEPLRPKLISAEIEIKIATTSIALKNDLIFAVRARLIKHLY
jgi:hypothetical protein